MTDSMLSAKTVGAIVAQVVGEAQLEAEFSARLKSRMVLTAEIRPTEVINEEATRMVSCSGNRKRKRGRPLSNENIAPEEKNRVEFCLKKQRRIILYLVGGFLSVAVVLIVILMVILAKESNGDDSLATTTNNYDGNNNNKNWWETLPGIHHDNSTNRYTDNYFDESLTNTDTICQSYEVAFQGMWDDIIQQGREDFQMECKCKENLIGLHHIICNDSYNGFITNTTIEIDTKHYICLKDGYGDDATENVSNDSSICAANTNYGYTFDDNTGEEVSFLNTIVYGEDSTRWNRTSILFRSYSKGEGPYCEVWVDGGQCEKCIPTYCGEEGEGNEDIGFVVSYLNLHNPRSSFHQGYSFDSCSDDPLSSEVRKNKNGYLEIFHAAVDIWIVECYDNLSCTTGQLPIFLKFFQSTPPRFRV